FVPLDTETDVPLAGAQTLVGVRRGRLDLEEGRQSRHERVRPGVVEQIVAALEVEVAEASVPAAPRPVRRRRHALAHDHARPGVEIDERGGHADVESLPEVAKRDGRVEAARGVAGAEVTLIVARADLQLEMLASRRA